MISLARLADVRTIVTHDSCADGTASAIILRDAFYDRDVPVRFLQYGSDAHRNLVPEPGMLFCDIVPPYDRAGEFVQAGALVLDHHKTARSVVEQFGEDGIFADEATEPGVCGAVLAYRHVWLPLKPQLSLAAPDEQYAIKGQFAHDFATLAGIRDTWQRKDPRWDEACRQSSILSFIPNDQWLSKSLSELTWFWEKDYNWLGKLLQDKFAADVARMAAKGWAFTTEKGMKVLIIPSKGLTSDVAELLDDKVDLIAGFGYTFEPEIGYPQMILSTRSHTTFDCSALCKAFGGGGHSKAAGCSFPVNPETANPYTFIENLIRGYESR